MDTQTLGRRMKYGRLAKGMTQKALAAVVGCSQSDISAYERDLMEPSAARGIVIALALHQDPLWLRMGIHSREVAP